MTYRHFIDRAHPIVEAVFGPPPADRAHALAHALERLDRRSVYVPGPPGRRPFDDLFTALTPADRLPLNCLNWCCLLVSHLRAGGIRAEDVFAAVITARGMRLDCNVVHAGVLVRGSAREWIWIDPAHPDPARLSGAELMARYVFAVVFNDRELYVRDGDKHRVLAGPCGRGTRVYLYGRADGRLRSLIRAPAFLRAVPDLCARGTIDGDRIDRETAEAAASAELLAPHGGGCRAGRRLVLVSAAAEAAVRDIAEPALDRYLEIVASGIGALRQAFADTAAGRVFEWNQVAHTIVPAMLMDLSVGQHLGLHDEVTERHGDAVVWAFEHVSADNGYGVVWTADPDRPGGFGQVWHRTVARDPMRLAPRMAAALGRMAAGEPIDEPKALLYLTHLGLVRRAAVAVPVFDASDAGRLMAPINTLAAKLVADALRPALARVADHPAWSPAATPQSTHAAVRLLLEYAIDRVVYAGVVPPFPAGGDAPLAWGRWVWIEPAGARALTPRVFDPVQAAVAG